MLRSMVMVAKMVIMMRVVRVQAGKVEATARGQAVAVQRAVGALIARCNGGQVLVRGSVVDAVAKAQRSVALQLGRLLLLLHLL